MKKIILTTLFSITLNFNSFAVNLSQKKYEEMLSCKNEISKLYKSKKRNGLGYGQRVGQAFKVSVPAFAITLLIATKMKNSGNSMHLVDTHVKASQSLLFASALAPILEWFYLRSFNLEKIMDETIFKFTGGATKKEKDKLTKRERRKLKRNEKKLAKNKATKKFVKFLKENFEIETTPKELYENITSNPNLLCESINDLKLLPVNKKQIYKYAALKYAKHPEKDENIVQSYLRINKKIRSKISIDEDFQNSIQK